MDTTYQIRTQMLDNHLLPFVPETLEQVVYQFFGIFTTTGFVIGNAKQANS